MDDYTREMMDLKTLVTRTLEKKGVLAKIRVSACKFIRFFFSGQALNDTEVNHNCGLLQVDLFYLAGSPSLQKVVYNCGYFK
ncbi:hypothetical protein H5410_022287 [Solanum commersonii]|uniref:Uncharacterized protein n=1 Tax=Solanum commersonii TaxID=4109 RepID=A0A9J5ZJ27_SOLCO|nr:hypothetical protein H5410_022287 [Solanum commersonii]